MDDDSRYEQRGGLAIISMNRPDKSNALSRAMRASLQRHLDRANADASVHCVLLRAEGDRFCSGLDLTDLPDSAEEWRSRVIAAQRNHTSIVRSTKTVIAAVQGAVVGGGASLALSADILIMAQDAFLSFPFVRLGIVADGGSSYFLQAKLGVPLATDLLLSAGRIDAASAKQHGLTLRVVPPSELMSAALALATELQALPHESLAFTKQLCQQHWIGGLDDALAREVELFVQSTDTLGHRAAMAAITKRINLS